MILIETVITMTNLDSNLISTLCVLQLCQSSNSHYNISISYPKLLVSLNKRLDVLRF